MFSNLEIKLILFRNSNFERIKSKARTPKAILETPCVSLPTRTSLAHLPTLRVVNLQHSNRTYPSLTYGGYSHSE